MKIEQLRKALLFDRFNQLKAMSIKDTKREKILVLKHAVLVEIKLTFKSFVLNLEHMQIIISAQLSLQSNSLSLSKKSPRISWPKVNVFLEKKKAL